MATDEANNISLLVSPIVIIVKSIYQIPWIRYLSWLLNSVGWILKTLSTPFLLLFRILLAVLSPAILVFSFFGGCVSWALGIIYSLEPLYIYFGTAATVGLIAGVFMSTSASLVTSILGIHQDDDGSVVARTKTRRLRKGGVDDSWSEGDGGDDSEGRYDASSSAEAEWRWLEASPTRRKQVSGLLSQTIHEEEDDTD